MEQKLAEISEFRESEKCLEYELNLIFSSTCVFCRIASKVLAHDIAVSNSAVRF